MSAPASKSGRLYPAAIDSSSSTACARRLDLAAGKRDVDRRRQETPAGGLIHRTLAVLRRGQRPLDRTPGVVNLAARQMEEREAGLPVIAKLVRPLECLGRPLQVAHPEPDLADLVVGEPEAIVQTEPLELLAGLACLQLGLRPLAAKHLQLRSMDAADARIAAHRLTAHPALALIGPLARALEIADVPTGGDRVAQDVARDPKTELAGGCRRRRLIEEGQTHLHVALVHFPVALEARRHELDIGVPVLPRHRDRAIRVLEAVRHPVVHHGTDGSEQMQPRVHARLGHALEQSRGAPQPSPTHRGRPAAEGHVAEMKRHASGLGRSTGLHVGGERPLERSVASSGLPAHQAASPISSRSSGDRPPSRSAAANASSASVQAWRLTASLPSSSEPAAAESIDASS